MHLKVDEVLQRMKVRYSDEFIPTPTIHDEELEKLRNDDWDDDTHQESIPTFTSCKNGM